MRHILLPLLILLLPATSFAQGGHGSMSAKPMTDFYNECPTRGYTKEDILETYTTSFRHDGELYMLSYEDKISVEKQGKRVPWTNIDMLDLEIYSRNLLLYKRRNDRWVKWTRPLFKSVTNGSNYVEFSNGGNAFVLDNGWVVLGLTYTMKAWQKTHSYPAIVLLCPIMSDYDYYNFEDYKFMPAGKSHRRVSEVIKKGHKQYSIVMNDDTEIALNFLFEENSRGYIDLFRLKDELGPSYDPSTPSFDGEMH